MVARAHQFTHVVYISGDEIRGSAAPLGNVFILIDHDDIGIRFEPLEAACRLRPKSYASDYQHAFSTHHLFSNPPGRFRNRGQPALRIRPLEPVQGIQERFFSIQSEQIKKREEQIRQ